jgi:prepilin-type N-terminal cleavage/methylation domain-containing protein
MRRKKEVEKRIKVLFPTAHPAAGKRQPGVTLAELVIVLVILGLLSAIAVPRLADTIRRQRLDNASRRLVEDIRLARSLAIRDKTDRSVVFEPVLQRYSLPDEPGLDGSTRPYVVQFNPQQGPVRLVSASFGGSSELVFSRLGVPAAGGSAALTDGVQQITVLVSPTTGRVSRVWQ